MTYDIKAQPLNHGVRIGEWSERPISARSRRLTNQRLKRHILQSFSTAIPGLIGIHPVHRMDGGWSSSRQAYRARPVDCQEKPQMGTVPSPISVRPLVC
ncbi:MAG: hypothetical protein Udaeo2_21430 [Candidatus Udaeobacter sp.]|nr:MAG: hypothetical protein Udaeo2_21430 [Candidatus Udaeobacter sp.]